MRKWLIPLLVIGGLAVILFFFFQGTYNKMVTKDEAVIEAWAQVENVYQRKFDLIPNMVSVAKEYAEFEQETFTQVTEARARATQLNIDPSNLTEENFQQFQAQYQELNQATFGRLLASFERYPNLKASEQFSKLMDELSRSENRISVERRRFNELVREYNTYVRKFPQNMLAGMYGFERKDQFEAEEAAAGGKVDVNEEFNK